MRIIIDIAAGIYKLIFELWLTYNNLILNYLNILYYEVKFSVLFIFYIQK